MQNQGMDASTQNLDGTLIIYSNDQHTGYDSDDIIISPLFQTC